MIKDACTCKEENPTSSVPSNGNIGLQEYAIDVQGTPKAWQQACSQLGSCHHTSLLTNCPGRAHE